MKSKLPIENSYIHIIGASQHNLKNISVRIPKNKITVITGVSGSGKSSLAYDVLLGEANRLFFATLSNYSRQFLDLSAKASVVKITGLSPAIGLTQRETRPSVRSHIAGFTDIGELLGALFANFSQTYCPEHDLPTEAEDLDQRTQKIIADHESDIIAIMVPIVTSRTGAFVETLTQYAEKGFSKVWIDGALTSLIPLPVLDKNKKHTLKLLVDAIKVSETNRARLSRALATALKEGKGFAEYALLDNTSEGSLKKNVHFSSKGGCPLCQYTWPKLDGRYFSTNSIGRCDACDGIGSLKNREEVATHGEDDLPPLDSPCLKCQGTGLGTVGFFARHHGFRLADIYQKTPEELLPIWVSLVSGVGLPNSQKILYLEIEQRLKRLCQLGLGALSLKRRLQTLSYGELQRLRLAQILATDLCGILYVIDEPSQGLHDDELDILRTVFNDLKQRGNTVVLIEHELAIIASADWIIDLGPGGGTKGGRVVAEFRPDEASKNAKLSNTAYFLSAFQKQNLKKNINPVWRENSAVHPDPKFLKIEQPRLFNLKMAEARFLLNGINLVTGFSGSGKNSLVLKILAQNVQKYLQKSKGSLMQFENCKEVSGLSFIETLKVIDRMPVGKSSQSMAITYLEIMSDVRSLFLATSQAQVLGLSSRDLSFQGGEGRCPDCRGRGYIVRKVKFLADAEVLCLTCSGKRFSDRVLHVFYHDRNFFDVLEMSLDEASVFFKNHRKISHRLKIACDIGLGYLKLGQSTSTYSGGEAQRIKLAAGLARKYFDDKTLIIISEPSLGLHNADIEKFAAVLRILKQQKVTTIVIDNHSAFQHIADWTLRLGPGSGINGGHLVSWGFEEFPRYVI